MIVCRFIVLCLVSLMAVDSAWSAPAVADLQAGLTASRSTYQQAKSRWVHAQAELKRIESAVAKAARHLAETNEKIRKNKRSIERTQQALAENKKRLVEQIHWLNQSLRGLSQWLNQPPFQWLLSSEDPSEWSRLTAYHRIIGQHQQEQVQALRATRQAILKQEDALRAMEVALSHERDERRAHLTTMKALQAQRSKWVATLRASMAEQSDHIREWEQRLNQQIQQLPPTTETETTAIQFVDQKGHLSWPVMGTVLPLFGQSISGSQLSWQGVLFKAPEDSLVRSVHAGRVVYADWMIGYGWLVIVEHDHGYMTLYGRNHYLYKRVGQTVRAGEVIARSGKSGGFDRPALYFSIRQNAQALNPVPWLSKKTRHRRHQGVAHA